MIEFWLEYLYQLFIVSLKYSIWYVHCPLKWHRVKCQLWYRYLHYQYHQKSMPTKITVLVHDFIILYDNWGWMVVVVICNAVNLTLITWLVTQFSLVFVIKNSNNGVSVLKNLLITGCDDVDFSLFPSRDYQLMWLRMYLEETALLRGDLSQCYHVCVRACVRACVLVCSKL